VRSHVHWDLGDLGEGSTAVTTFGEGDFDLAGEPEELLQGWIMAGPLGVFRGEGAANGFSAAWLGAPAFDAAAEMEWAARMYAYLGKAYQYLNPPPPYRVFIRVLPDARGATALANSFMLVASPAGANAAPAASPRETMTHEMGHMWVGGVEGPLGVTSWFSEGLNTYYTRLLPMRGGFDSVSAYGRRVNADFRDYYTNVARNLSADSIVAIGFNDENVRHIPYARGSFYFADLDSKIRAASHGRRNLDTLMLDVFRRRARGERFDHEAWIAAVTREIGPTARSDFERVILNGGTIVPASDAFGPCFVRRAAQLTSRAGQPKVNGYEWIRVDSIPDTRCRVW
jgi:predicted metalloprotease with PDZ domain